MTNMRSMMKYACIVSGFLIILVVNVMRFYNTNNVPYGAQVDELAGAVTVECLATEGVDAHNRSWPLFSDLNFGTPKPPTYLYPAVLWTKLFGYSMGSFRAFTAFFFVLGLAGLFALGMRVFGFYYGLWALLLGAISPWTWNLSRVSFESLGVVTFIVWGIFFAYSKPIITNVVMTGGLLSLSMYAYPPARLQIPLTLLLISLIKICKKEWRLKEVVMVSISFLIFSLPLVSELMRGHLMTRFNDISIFSSEYLSSVGRTASWGDISKLFVWNYFSHFNLDYLFLSGDVNYIHSTRSFGILSWADALGLFLLILLILLSLLRRKRFGLSKPHYWWLAFLLISSLIAVIPSALTNEGLPHSLRTVIAWPFVILIVAWGLWQGSRLWFYVMPTAIIIALFFSWALLHVYFVDYPQKSKGMFGFWTREEAALAKTDEDWVKFMYRYRRQDYHFRYYLMNEKGVSCTKSREVWLNLRDFLTSKGVY